MVKVQEQEEEWVGVKVEAADLALVQEVTAYVLSVSYQCLMSREYLAAV